MLASEIISYARRLCGGITTNQISDTFMLTILNKSYKDLYKKIINIDKNYFWSRWTTDTVANQFEYGFTQPSGTTYGLFKPEKMRIKYLSTEDYKNITLTDWDSLIETPEYCAVNQSKEEPLAIFTNTKYVHIFPTPTEAITEGLLFEGAKKPYDLTISSTANDILIEPLYHETLAYMMCPSIYKERGLDDKKNDSLNEAELEIQKALKSMGLIKTSVIRCKLPDLDEFE